ncbi:Organic solute transporter Ostalpha [Plasmodiophora brassicae]
MVSIVIVIGQSATILAGVCAAIATVLTFSQVRDHIRFNQRLDLRKHVNRILLMCPVYAWTSFLSTVLGGSIYWDTARDCYEAFVIYSFFKFMSSVLQGESAMIVTLRSKPQQEHFFPFSLLPRWKMGKPFYYKVQWGILQYVAVKPMMAVVALFLGALGVYHEGAVAFNAGYFYVTFVVNASQIWAMYCLIIMYLAFRSDLSHVRPVPKMLCIKGLIFFTFWQSVSIALFVSWGFLIGSHDEIARLEDLVVCVEMVAFAIAHRYAFPSSDFSDGSSVDGPHITTPMFRSLLTAADVSDVIEDLRQGIVPVSGRVTPDETVMITTSATTFIAHDPYRPPSSRSASVNRSSGASV